MVIIFIRILGSAILACNIAKNLGYGQFGYNLGSNRQCGNAVKSHIKNLGSNLGKNPAYWNACDNMNNYVCCVNLGNNLGKNLRYGNLCYSLSKNSRYVNLGNNMV